MTPDEIQRTLDRLRKLQSSIDQAEGRRSSALARLKALGIRNIKAAEVELAESGARLAELETEAANIADEVQALIAGADE
jgi:hypothetical protein